MLYKSPSSKKKSITVALLLMLLISVLAGGLLVNVAIADSELIAWWKLNEGDGTVVSDSSGNNYQGTIHGASWTNSEGNSSLSFNGVSDYVSLPSLDRTNLDSLTVVTWINSDLTEVGYIIYHGYLGEFEMCNGDLERALATYASFNVKLSDSKWYGAQSSYPMEPNIWHQIVGVWEKGVSVKVYVDGVLAGENDNISVQRLFNPEPSYTSSLGIYCQGQRNIVKFFKGQMSNVMIFNRALTSQEISALYGASFPTLAKPTLDISGKSSASYFGFNVEIKGSLTLNETGIPEAPILLSYSVNGGKSWQDLTFVYTDSDGSFSATWLPSVTGNYLIQAKYEGNATCLGTAVIVNLAIVSFADKDVFSVTSNSTVSSLVFDSENQELSFTVTGPSGTAGYVDVYVAKNIVKDINDVKAHVDDSEVNYTSSSIQDSWLIHLTYQHSSHEVILSFDPETPLDLGITTELAIILGAAIAIVLVSVVAISVDLQWYFKKHEHKAYNVCTFHYSILLKEF